jgi:hypothetical protein
MKLLMGAVTDGNFDSLSSMRALSFYIKPLTASTGGEEDRVTDLFKKVKISTGSMERSLESIRDVLETVGADNIPSRPEGMRSYRSFIPCSSSEMKSFFSGLIDRLV